VLTKSPKRVCFSLQVKPGRIAEYKARHAAVWPEMLNALTQAGWHNYSLFLREDGLLVGYMETPDLTRALRQMASSEITAKWQAEMAGFFDSPPGSKADEQIQPMEQVFHLLRFVAEQAVELSTGPIQRGKAQPFSVQALLAAPRRRERQFLCSGRSTLRDPNGEPMLSET
jgi:L-rhamnose mutarotase